VGCRLIDSPPSVSLLQDDLAIQQQWYINGRHYSRTLEDWLKRMDAQKKHIIPLFQVTIVFAPVNIFPYKSLPHHHGLVAGDAGHVRQAKHGQVVGAMARLLLGVLRALCVQGRQQVGRWSLRFPDQAAGSTKMSHCEHRCWCGVLRGCTDETTANGCCMLAHLYARHLRIAE
jgi:hypothetical protein